jgi:LysM repeat protein
MSPESNTQSTKTCPTCGTRLSENASRCLVCGRSFVQKDATGSSRTSSAPSAVKGSRLPQLTLSLPLILLLVILFIGIGGGGVYFLTRQSAVQPTPLPPSTPTLTATLTPTASNTPTITATASITPTASPLPTIQYTIKSLDTCIKISTSFKISIPSIQAINPGINADCTNLVVGDTIFLPQPTPTIPPQATSTLSSSQSTETACEKVPYTVKDGDTLGGIADSFNVYTDAIKEENGLTSDTVFSGNVLQIPLCKRKPTPGPTPTPTLPPPYQSPNLLLPADGTFFASASDVITLQWSSVNALLPNEAYAITIEDLTSGNQQRTVNYVSDTKYTVPDTLRPAGGAPHIFRWWVVAVRQTGTGQDGQPIWSPAGASSTSRVFGWMVIAGATPQP